MRWYRLAYGAPGPSGNNDPIQRKSPDVVDKGLRDEPGMGIAPSPYDPTKPRNNPPKPKKRRKLKRRRPGPDLSETPKKPTDAVTDRPDGDLRT